MITKEITYEDFDGNKVTETFYFHLNKVELTKFALDYPEGIDKVLSKATASGDNKEVFALIEKFLLSSYGIRAEDGKGFTKTAEITKKFQDSFAYEALYEELIANDTNASMFIKGIMPKGFIPEDTTLEDLSKPKSPIVINLPPVPTKE